MDSLLLSEVVYKAADEGPAAALAALNVLCRDFPPGAISLSEVQFCEANVGHRCAVGCAASVWQVQFCEPRVGHRCAGRCAFSLQEVQFCEALMGHRCGTVLGLIQSPWGAFFPPTLLFLPFSSSLPYLLPSSN